MTQDSTSHVSNILRTWFAIHFIADLVFAIPLMIAPVTTLTMVGWSPDAVDPLSTRLVGSALMGIGIESLLGRNANDHVYLAMLNLKSIWSLSATVGILLSLLEWGDQAPWGGWMFFGIFLSFSTVWNLYRIKLKVALSVE